MEGTFVSRAGATQAEWRADASVVRLRWPVDGRLYEIAKLGDTAGIEHLDREAMVGSDG